MALGDEIGAVLGAELVLVLIGERPGLSAADSLGAYLTYRPRVGCPGTPRATACPTSARRTARTTRPRPGRWRC